MENVPESEAYVTEVVTGVARLCGTMMGHRVFKHRVVYCNYNPKTDLPHSHHGKLVGARGLYPAEEGEHRRFEPVPEPNMWGVYGSRTADRGSAAEWHGALGYAVSTYSHRGLSTALPRGFGRLLAPQLIAHSLYRQFGCPVVSPVDRDEMMIAAIEEWSRGGYSPLATRLSSSLARPQEHRRQPSMLEITVADGGDTQSPANPEGVLSPSADQTDTVPPMPVSPYVISRERQCSDPLLFKVMSSLENESTPSKVQQALASKWTMQDDLLWRLSTSEAGEPVRLLAVPENYRGSLLAHYHYTHHRGSDVLFNQIHTSFYWPAMRNDCLDFTNSCVICAQRRVSPMQLAPVQHIETPRVPFSVIHLDHKTGLPLSDGYSCILLVVCALTRYCLLRLAPRRASRRVAALPRLRIGRALDELHRHRAGCLPHAPRRRHRRLQRRARPHRARVGQLHRRLHRRHLARPRRQPAHGRGNPSATRLSARGRLGEMSL